MGRVEHNVSILYRNISIYPFKLIAWCLATSHCDLYCALCRNGASTGNRSLHDGDMTTLSNLDKYIFLVVQLRTPFSDITRFI